MASRCQRIRTTNEDYILRSLSNQLITSCHPTDDHSRIDWSSIDGDWISFDNYSNNSKKIVHKRGGFISSEKSGGKETSTKRRLPGKKARDNRGKIYRDGARKTHRENRVGAMRVATGVCCVAWNSNLGQFQSCAPRLGQSFRLVG